MEKRFRINSIAGYYFAESMDRKVLERIRIDNPVRFHGRHIKEILQANPSRVPLDIALMSEDYDFKYAK